MTGAPRKVLCSRLEERLAKTEDETGKGSMSEIQTVELILCNISPYAWTSDKIQIV